VSALDPTNTVRVDNVTVPALTVRRANTTVELRDGESLAIGGLFQHTAQTDIKQIPGLGEIPILSALFRSTRYQRNETELLIIVTPRVVTQDDVNSAKDRNLPGAEPKMPAFLLNGAALDKPMAHDLRGPIEAPAPAPPAAAAAPAADQALRGPIAPAIPTAAPAAAATVPASGK
jgi:pilus assembly protein CpaC